MVPEGARLAPAPVKRTARQHARSIGGLCVLALAAVCVVTKAAAPVDAPEETAQYRAWVAEMKRAERGPFARIRWFCKDGSIQPPESYACKDHGGGAQHGEWTDRVETLRASGYWIANVYSDLDIDALLQRPNRADIFAQMIIEQFLIALDDGWIFRRARYYRGALQAEGELRGARRLLFKLAERPEWLQQRYVLLRIGSRFIPHGQETDQISTVRQLSADLAKRDPGFASIRNKIHVRPERADAVAVSEYARGRAPADLTADYERLAAAIRHAYEPSHLIEVLRNSARELAGAGNLSALILNAVARLEPAGDAAERLAVTGELLAALRDRITVPNGPRERMSIIDATLELEGEHFAAATALRGRLDAASRREILSWLQAGVSAMYGSGLLSSRERGALATELALAADRQVNLARYKRTLDYLARVPGWSNRLLELHFGEAMRKLAEIEPLSSLFIQDQLRGSPLFFYSQALERLLQDADRLAGVRNELFEKQLGGGLRSLNPGLARGVLHLALDPNDVAHFDREGIYALRETVAELPPVAGIITAGEGNPLSHVQLLARNLGIPNVAIDESLIERLRAHEGEPIILAASPAGSVRILLDDGSTGDIFAQEAVRPDTLIQPDLDKLDLTYRTLTPLSQLRASDSGRIVGPKAAKLGELKHHFPEAVAEGLAIPFGEFRALLQQTMTGTSLSVFDWMLTNYASIGQMPAHTPEREARTEAFRARLQSWVTKAGPGEAFRARLRSAMADVFGANGSYGVFVRSDTNVEDLPGFTGAGLNLTVANVVGFDAICDAISQVWASPFSARAFAWRQALMDQPQHVYPAVLLLKSVPVDKSGVLVTRDIDTGAKGWLSVAVNEGVGGAVDGQAAESLRIEVAGDRVRLLAQATAPWRRTVPLSGGVVKVPTSGGDAVLTPDEINRLRTFARELPQRFPAITDAQGRPAPADVEFGFLNGELKLFQIRPFLESAWARSSAYLNKLDSGMADLKAIRVDLDQPPGS